MTRGADGPAECPIVASEGDAEPLCYRTGPDCAGGKAFTCAPPFACLHKSTSQLSRLLLSMRSNRRLIGRDPRLFGVLAPRRLGSRWNTSLWWRRSAVQGAARLSRLTLSRRRRASPDGRTWWCRDCFALAKRQYRQRHGERLNAARRRDPLPERTCRTCGQRFTPVRKDQNYCRPWCREHKYLTRLESESR